MLLIVSYYLSQCKEREEVYQNIAVITLQVLSIKDHWDDIGSGTSHSPGGQAPWRIMGCLSKSVVERIIVEFGFWLGDLWEILKNQRCCQKVRAVLRAS